MMTLLKKNLAVALAVVLCLGLTACFDIGPDIGGDWRVTGIVRDGGTITRDGEETFVLVCVHKADATFYYDSEDQVLFDSVDYPITLEGNPWEMFQSIDFADRNGDDNSDVAMIFHDGGNTLLMVWFWDAENAAFVYQPEESQLGKDDDDGLIPELMSGPLPFGNMESLESETYEDGTYYCMDISEDGVILVVNTVQATTYEEDDPQMLADCLAGCALSIRNADSYLLQTVEKSEAYTAQMGHPVYIVTYTAGEAGDSREWTVFAMATDRGTYLYGLSVPLDAADTVNSVYQDIFAGLYLGGKG